MSHPVADGLRSPDPAARRAACAAAVDDPSAVLLLDALGEALADPDRSVVRAASEALAALARRVDGVLASLERALRRPAFAGRTAAALVWARLEPPPVKLLPLLVDGLESADAEQRWPAARALVDMGRNQGEVLPLLVQLVEGGERPAARAMAVYALRELAPDEPVTARALLAASEAPDPALRRAALTASAGLIAPPAAVVERLEQARRTDPDAESRRIAARALEQLAGERR